MVEIILEQHLRTLIFHRLVHLQLLDAVQGEGLDVVLPVPLSQQIPPAPVLLQVVRVQHHLLRLLHHPSVHHVQHLPVLDGLKQYHHIHLVLPRGPFEAHNLLLAPYDVLVQVYQHLVHPFEVGPRLEFLQHVPQLLHLNHLVLSQLLVVYRADALAIAVVSSLVPVSPYDAAPLV